jgi:hypothetical protein
MKDGTTHLAHKAQHAVDLGEDAHGAIRAVNICDAAAGDPATITTLVETTQNLRAVSDDERAGGWCAAGARCHAPTLTTTSPAASGMTPSRRANRPSRSRK